MGWQELDYSFEKLRMADQVGVIPYVTAGFPTRAMTIQLIETLEQSGSVAIELGVPFSDPMADGTTIQRASFQAIKEGITLSHCFEICSELRSKGAKVPFVLMGYYNSFLSFGLERCARVGKESGVDGFIVADLPNEESGPFSQACDNEQLALVPLLAPTSTEHRVEQACVTAKGFIYGVSISGVTGARTKVSSNVGSLVSLIRRHSKLPVAVGFGISTKRHVEELSGYADSVVVGSALLDAIMQSTAGQEIEAVRVFMKDLQGIPSLINRSSP
ncbi:tryptophan synthase subunit alpha [SAR202 cluster bacterium AD-802-E10_MRT_200m]|nr:tryptophan synthase subunit alpha [SAR202 cluster bacterium AD-802-E10_MRT_200m]MQF82596.1 tryptophan synthase subunit alpha [SAR202 cluster bacterium AD-802-E10_MRT_200m]